MDVQEELLQRFTRMIDLPAFIAQRGFRLSEQPEPGHLCMTDPSIGETLRLEKDVERGSWTYSNAVDPSDRGTVVDYLQRRDGTSRAACVDRLAACCDERRHGPPEAARYQAFLRAAPQDLRLAEREHERFKLAELATTKALERLGLPRGTLDDWRFSAPKCESDVATLTDEPKTL
jgi:hypothetical protein